MKGKPEKKRESELNRRQFIAGAGAAGVALGAARETLAQTAPGQGGATPPSEQQRLRDQGTPPNYSGTSSTGPAPISWST
jgi:hypothetical protein